MSDEQLTLLRQSGVSSSCTVPGLLPSRKPPPTFETPFFGLLLPSSDLLRLSIFYQRALRPWPRRRRCVVAALPRRHARADARRGHRESAAIDLNKILKLGSRLLPLRQGHHLQGGTVRARPWPLSPAHARTHLTLPHGPSAHAAADHFACAVPRGQEPGVDEHPPGAQFLQRAQRAHDRAAHGERDCSPSGAAIAERKGAAASARRCGGEGPAFVRVRCTVRCARGARPICTHTRVRPPSRRFY